MLAQDGERTSVEYKSDHSAFVKLTWLTHTKSPNHVLPLEP